MNIWKFVPLLAIGLIGSFAAAQAGPKATKVRLTTAGPVELRRQPEVIRGEVEAFPHLIPGAGLSEAVAQKINASLDRDNARVLPLALDCEKDAGKGGKRERDAWTRSIEVTMRGPRFVAFLVTDDYDCGGPYPNFGMRMPLVYDLANGSPVNWAKFLPPSGTGALDTASDGSNVGLVKWNVLKKRSKAQADGDCKDVFETDDDTLAYSINLNAQTGTLDAQPATFPHVLQACANTISLDGNALRKLGVSKDVIDALASAHALQNK